MLISVTGFSQNAEKQKKRSEKIEALRIGYITEALELSVEESKLFWPVYNAHEKKKKEIAQGRHRITKNEEIEDASEATQIIEDELRIERALLDLKTEYIADLRKVLSDLKIAKLFQANKRFRKELLENMKGRRQGREKRFNRN